MSELASPVSAFSMYQNQSKKRKISSSKYPSKKKSFIKKPTGIKKKHILNASTEHVHSNKKLIKHKKKPKKLENHIKAQTKKDIVPNGVAPLQPKLKLKSRPSTDSSTSSSVEESSFYNKPRQAFEWIIAPLKPEDFFKQEWEKGPLYIKRNCEQYYKDILTTDKLDVILHENSLFYTRNVDVVSYIDGKRETHNPEGRAIAAVLWDYYQNGCSIRILNPHTYCPKLHLLLAALQEYFGCMAGVNAYLTPPNSQGFAPHYDDIEAFVLQLEGRKHWKLYAPLSKSEVLPRFSSKNLDRSTLKAPIKEITLEAGDLLYFPRGMIHEGSTDAGAHSLHITVSIYQKTAYVDLLEHVLKPALTTACRNHVEFREGLPLQYLKHVGLANASHSSKTRNEIIGTVRKLFDKMVQYIDVDGAADNLGKQFMWDSMPPVPSKLEKLHMVHGNGEQMVEGTIQNKVEITVDVEVRLLRYHCIRVMKEEEETDTNSLRVYYNTENAKYYHGEELQFFVIDSAFAPAIEHLIHNYPNFVEVQSLPLDDDTDKMQIVSDLWERGLLVTSEPLKYDD